MTAWNVAFASRAADVKDAVVHLGRRREPISETNRRLQIRVAFLEHIQNHAGLAAFAEALDWLSRLGVEGEQERARSRVDDAVCVTNPAVAEDVAFSRSASKETRDVVRPQE